MWLAKASQGCLRISIGDSNSLSLDMALRTTMGAWVDLFTSYMAWGKALRDIVAQWVQQIPFSLVVKECDLPSRNEAIALRLVEQHTSIPAPRVMDRVEHRGKIYLIMYDTSTRTAPCGCLTSDVVCRAEPVWRQSERLHRALTKDPE
ncbi:hypothetical protein BDV33DRAFT_167416 [Aspergillus novoparasiticus]|uniref:Aminoglycoside phosphotransferase domain-containing protein n=1 Tax=Aspergillus novoparasiticus TaxID=986946 RepID=A0A5N6F0I6_9EURO|nr:hypothetical protein BDV33DRAFT_167416 [Aspergillus novoparasiticus]